MKPNDIGVLQAFENLDLFEDTIVSIIILANFFLLENDLTHFLKSVLDLSVLVKAKIDNCVRSSSKFLLNDVLVNHFSAFFRLAPFQFNNIIDCFAPLFYLAGVVPLLLNVESLKHRRT